MTFISYAQNFEDVMLWRALKHVENGFYIDIGAQDPVVDSVSLAFYEHGWRGIHVEPVLDYVNQLATARPDETVIPAAVGNGGGLMPFFVFTDTGLSTADAAIAQRHKDNGFQCVETKVPVISLDEILETANTRPVHWLKLDVEGMEKDVLKSWKKSNIKPWVLVVESTLPLSQEESHQHWEQRVLSRNYEFIYFDGLNRYYVSNEHPELKSAFVTSPNIFDGFVFYSESRFFAKDSETLHSLKTVPGTQLYACAEKIEHLSSELSARDARIETLNENLHERSSELAELSTELSARDSRIAALGEELHERTRQFEELSSELSTRDNKVEALNQDFHARDARIKVYLQTIAELSDQVQAGKHEAHRWWLAHEDVLAQLDAIRCRRYFKLIKLLRIDRIFAFHPLNTIKTVLRPIVLRTIKKVLSTPRLHCAVKPVVKKIPFLYGRLYQVAMNGSLFCAPNVNMQLASIIGNGGGAVIFLGKKASRVLEDIKKEMQKTP